MDHNRTIGLRRIRGRLPKGLARDLAITVGLAVVYYVAARWSLSLALVREQVTPIWPPTGIAVVGLLLFGRRMWPGIAVGAFLVNAPIGPNLLATAGIAFGNTLAPLVAVSLMHWAGFRREMEGLRDTAAIAFLGALLGMTVSATTGTLTLLLSGAVTPDAFLPTWSVWWTGDAMGVLVFAPFLLSLRRPPGAQRIAWHRRVEAGILFAILAIASHVVFRSGLPIQYLVFPGLAWAAWRFGQRGAAPAVLISSGIAIWAAVQGVGPFAGTTLLEKMVTLQLFNASAALSSFFLAAVVSERRQHLSARQEAEDELLHRALHDPLTGLANRTLFMDRLHQALARSARHPGATAVVFLDLDRFKVINDSLGHEAGDHVLKLMAERLRGVVREMDTASRFGGDEFLILCEELAGKEEAVFIAERLARVIAQPMELEGGEVVVTTSIGIALTGGPDDRPEDLVRDADAALYRAKDRGRARYELFDHPMRAGAVKRLAVEAELRRALDRGELRLHYQPIVRTDDGRLTGLEALVRWQHPERGLLLPSEFVPVAEETGLIVPLGAWVLEEACRQWTEWQPVAKDGASLGLAVNISAAELGRPQFPKTLDRLLTSTGMDASDLSLEITESVLLEASTSALDVLRHIRHMGVRMVIDDFGTGYSSLGYLKRLKVSGVKVDRSFVYGLGRDSEDSAIVAAIVSLAHALGVVVVAEGVETAAQVEGLRVLHCELAQGHYFSPPLPAEAMAEFLRIAQGPMMLPATRASYR
jgi:diguanylate cyclase (GGDEF)-like protein